MNIIKNEDSKMKTPLLFFFEDVFPVFIFISPGEWFKRLFIRSFKKKSSLEDELLKKEIRKRELIIVELWVVLKFILAVCILFISPSFFREHFWSSVIIAIWSIAETLVATIFLIAIKPGKSNNPDEVIELPIRTIFLAFLNYIQISSMFAVLLICASSEFKTSFEAFYFSTFSITTLGYSDIKASEFSTQLLVILELYSGLILIVMAISVLVSKLSENVRVSERKG